MTGFFQVYLLTEEKLIQGNITKIVERYYSKAPWNNKTTWILCFGIFDFIDIKVNDCCLTKKCANQLVDISNEFTMCNVDWKVQYAISNIMKFERDLKRVLPEKTVVLVAPPIQTAMLQLYAFRKDHYRLHRVASKYQLFLCSSSNFYFSKIFYMRLLDKWLDTFINPGRTCARMMRNYITVCKDKCLKLLDASLHQVNIFGKEWSCMMMKVISTIMTPLLIGVTGVQLSLYLSELPNILVVEPSQTIGKTLTFNLQGKPDEDDRFFHQVVVVGNQMPAELTELCLKLSIHVVQERVTFDEAGKALIRKYEKFWNVKTLWVILTDVLHLAIPDTIFACKKENCNDPIPIFRLDKLKSVKGPKKWGAYKKLKIEQFISKVKNFSESLVEYIGEGSAVFLPPVIPVFLMKPDLREEHKFLHDRHNSYGKISMVYGKINYWKRLHLELKQAWLDMLKPYLENYSEPKRIIECYSSSDPKQDWITTIGKLLVYFASASIDDGNAVFSDGGKC